MNRTIMVTVFLVVFTAVYGGMHYYALGRLIVWYGFGFTVPLLIVLTLLILSFPVASLLEQTSANRATNIFYDIAAVWMGSITILLLVVGIMEIPVFLGVPAHIGANLAIILAVGLSGFALFEARNPVIRKHTITGNVKKAVKVAVATDVHAGPVHGKNYLKHVVEAMLREKPDIIVFPGDLVDGPGRLPDDVLQPLDNLEIPAFYSWGNHEQYVGEREVERVSKDANIRTLRNESAIWNGITIIGIDDAEDNKQVAKILPGIKKEGFSILLYHRPMGLEDAAKERIDLMLSGHTHRGQVFPFSLLVKLAFPRIYGWYEHKGTKLYVSSGAGTWGPPMRLGSKSEIIIITILPKP